MLAHFCLRNMHQPHPHRQTCEQDEARLPLYSIDKSSGKCCHRTRFGCKLEIVHKESSGGASLPGPTSGPERPSGIRSSRIMSLRVVKSTVDNSGSPIDNHWRVGRAKTRHPQTNRGSAYSTELSYACLGEWKGNISVCMSTT